MLGICPDVDAGRHHARHHRRTTCSTGALRARGGVRVLSRRHHLPGGRRSGRRLGAPRHRRRGGRLPLRRARQRRADAGLPRDAAEEGRRADRAPLRAADREPHVRGARSVRAGGGLAGQGHSARRRSAARSPTIQRLDIPLPDGRATRCGGVVLRVDRFGNLVTNIDRRRSRRSRGSGADHASTPAATASRGSSPPTPRSRAGRSLRAVRQHRSPRARRQRRAAPPSALGLARGAVVEIARG